MYKDKLQRNIYSIYKMIAILCIPSLVVECLSISHGMCQETSVNKQLLYPIASINTGRDLSDICDHFVKVGLPRVLFKLTCSNLLYECCIYHSGVIQLNSYFKYKGLRPMYIYIFTKHTVIIRMIINYRIVWRYFRCLDY